MAVWVGVWSAIVESGRTDARTLSRAEGERRATQELAVAARELEGLIADPDDEVRALYFLLLGAAGDVTPRTWLQFKSSYDAEQDPMVKASIVQATVRTLIRAPESSEVAAWILDRVDHGGPLVEARVGREVASVYHSPVAQQRLEELFGLRIGRLRLLRKTAPAYPSEGL